MLLSVEQKKRICILARKVWANMSDSQKSQYRNADGGQSETAAFNLWRHGQQSSAIGRFNLTHSSNDEFCILMAHFALLANDSDSAASWLMRFSNEARRRVFWLIKSNCTNGIQFPKYPDAIAQAQFGCRIWEASTKQLYNILSTVRNRASAKRKQNKNNQMELGL